VTLPEAVLAYDGTALRVSGLSRAPATAPLLVADSWLIADGRARFLAQHRDRFLGACQAAGADYRTLVSFWDAVEACLPRGPGHWFPRVELGHGGELRLRSRPAPPLAPDVALWVSDGRDPRRCPRVKGPDFPALHALRARAGAHGADDALITSTGGTVLEGASTSLTWWTDDGVLCVPDDDLPVLPGVTVDAIRQRASSLGIKVLAARRPAAELAGCESWALNALHGLRPVRCWTSPAMPPPPVDRAKLWQEWLLSQMREI
jgi:branched-subunit amino acid aminotransferase/4-amino-4-deoxychorismate lyase